MIRNRLTVGVVIACMIVGAFALTFHRPASQQVCQTIEGDHLAPAPANYAFVALKANDAASQKLAADFESNPKFQQLHKLAACKTYKEGDAYLSHNLKAIRPPAVVVMRGNEIVYKRSGPSVKLASTDIDTCFPRLRPQPKPEPKPEPDDEPKVPEHPDVTPEAPDTVPAADKNGNTGLLLIAALGAIGGLIGYFTTD